MISRELYYFNEITRLHTHFMSAYYSATMTIIIMKYLSIFWFTNVDCHGFVFNAIKFHILRSKMQIFLYLYSSMRYRPIIWRSFIFVSVIFYIKLMSVCVSACQFCVWNKNLNRYFNFYIFMDLDGAFYFEYSK